MENDFLAKYNEIIDMCYDLGRQNYCLFQFIANQGLEEEWNEFVKEMKRQKKWMKER